MTAPSEIVEVVIPKEKEPDVFETEDAPDDSQKENVDYIIETANESIEKEKLSAKEAFSKFSDKSFDTNAQNYSDSLLKKRMKRGGLLANQTDFELQPTGEKEESLAQRFHRLQYEVKSFLQEMEQKKTEKTEEAAKQADLKVDPANIVDELSQLQNLIQKTIEDEKMRAIIDPKVEIEMAANLQQELSNKLIAELQAYVSKPSQPNQSGKESVTYELFYKPDQAKHMQATKVADLEKRITELEQIIGSKQLLEPSFDLLSTSKELKEKLTLLVTPKQLEVIQRTVVSLSSDLDKLAEKKHKQEEDPSVKMHETKVNEMFDMMHRWDMISLQLPTIVSRLQALKSLHEGAASFSQGVQLLETQQEGIKKLLKFNGDLMTQVESNFKTNLNTIQTNVQVLEKRFAELSKKLDELGLETF